MEKTLIRISLLKLSIIINPFIMGTGVCNIMRCYLMETKTIENENKNENNILL